ncbi:MAG: hypothetical protein LBU61_00875 [Coriobacteriales bacterium]|nr:hypothetical protein [Coriobacteriales bacterium]
MKRLINPFTKVLLSIGLAFSLLTALPTTAYGAPPGLGDYELGDIYFINQIIDDNSLSWNKWLDNEANQPADWGTRFVWDNAFPKRLISIDLEAVGITTLPAFPDSLIKIDCSKNTISALPNLPSGLETLYCEACDLAALPALPATLKALYCPENKITILPALPAGLEELCCAANQITVLPAWSNDLTLLDCSFNQIAVLPALSSNLLELYCRENKLTVLPELPAGLLVLDCNDNQIITLPALSPTLTGLFCNNNQIAVLPALPATLINLHCADNKIAELPALTPVLETLYCNGNLLTALPDLSSVLKSLDCSDNQLIAIPIPLPTTLLFLDISKNQITAQPYPLPDEIIAFMCNDNLIQSIDTANCYMLAKLQASNNPLVQMKLTFNLTVRVTSVGNGKAVANSLIMGNGEFYIKAIAVPLAGSNFKDWEYDNYLEDVVETGNQLSFTVPMYDSNNLMESIITANFVTPPVTPDPDIPSTPGTGDLFALAGSTIVLLTSMLGISMIIWRKRQLSA